MCVHVFGGASSPSCCNHALKRSAIDNEVQFGLEAAKTLRRNLCVDDLLKSTPDAQSAIILIKAVTKICKGSGFKLGKFISNNTVVLKSLQEDQRRKGVKAADLSSGELPVERALRVQWNIDEDMQGLIQAIFDIVIPILGTLIWVCRNLILRKTETTIKCNSSFLIKSVTYVNKRIIIKCNV